MTQPGIKPTSTVSVAAALSTRPLIGPIRQYILYALTSPTFNLLPMPFTNYLCKTLALSRSNFTACIIEDKLVVIGGFNGNSTCSDVEYFEDELRNYRSDFSQGIPSIMSEEERNANDSLSNVSEVGESSTSFLASSIAFTNNPQIIRRNKIRIENGRWRNLPNMQMSRSALSCCVLTGLAPNFLNSLMQQADS